MDEIIQGGFCKIMKKKFDKMNKVMAGVGMIGLLLLVALAASNEDGVSEGFPFVLEICLLAILGFLICLMISVVLAFIEGWKNNRKDFFKKVIELFGAFFVTYTILTFLDGDPINFLKIVMHAGIAVVGIIGGEYMLRNHA